MTNIGAYSTRSTEIVPAGLSYGYAPQVPAGDALNPAQRRLGAASVLEMFAAQWKAGDFAGSQTTQSNGQCPPHVLLSMLIDPATPTSRYGAIAFQMADRLDCRAELNASLQGPPDPMHLEMLGRMTRGEPLDVVLRNDRYGGPWQLAAPDVLDVLARAPDDHTRAIRPALHDCVATYFLQRQEARNFLLATKLADPARKPARDRQTLEKVSRYCIDDLDVGPLRMLCEDYVASPAGAALPVISTEAAARLLDRGLRRFVQLRREIPDARAVTCREDLVGVDRNASGYWRYGDGRLGRLECELTNMHRFVAAIRCPEEAQFAPLRAACTESIEDYARLRLREIRESGGGKYMASMSEGACRQYPNLGHLLMAHENAGGGLVNRLKNRVLSSARAGGAAD